MKDFKLAIMQPYFFPYVGYFQLMDYVDSFIIYDNIEFTKKGWINRNRFLRNGAATLFSLPLEKAPDRLHVIDRQISASYQPDKLVRQLESAYRKAPFFDETMPIISSILLHEEKNLFHYIFNSIKTLAPYLHIDTSITVSSHIDIDHTLKSQDKVIAISEAMGAKTYVNNLSGSELYHRQDFEKAGISLEFMDAIPFPYQQFNSRFVERLSILDVLMFLGRDGLKTYLGKHYDIR